MPSCGLVGAGVLATPSKCQRDRDRERSSRVHDVLVRGLELKVPWRLLTLGRTASRAKRVLCARISHRRCAVIAETGISGCAFPVREGKNRALLRPTGLSERQAATTRAGGRPRLDGVVASLGTACCASALGDSPAKI